MVLVRLVPADGGQPARVDVLGAFDIKDALRSQLRYTWNPETKAWWTTLKDNTLSKLKARARPPAPVT